MRIAEALLERSDLQKRIEALRARVNANASYQEGEEPNEDAAALLEECLEATGKLARLVTAINLTNAVVTVDDGRSLTQLLAEREGLRAQHAILVTAADSAGGSRMQRQLRSELRQVTALPVGQLRSRADAVAVQLRAIDVTIQKANWEVELIGK